MKSIKPFREAVGKLNKEVSELLMSFDSNRPQAVFHRFRDIWIAVFLFLAAGSLPAADFYVSPSGSSSGTGSISSPWDIATALKGPSMVHAGDTIWLRGGRYTGYFTANLSGTAAAPIIIRQYAGERAILDANGDTHATLTVNGSYVWFWGFEIASSYSSRVSTQTGPWPSDLPNQPGLYINQGSGDKFINLIIHDNPLGACLWSGSQDIEAYGCVIYYNGWNAPDRAHGHGIYMQNATGGKQVNDCIIFDNADHGIQAYGSSAATVNNCSFTGNIIFDNSNLFPAYQGGRNLLVGGDLVAQNPVLRNNALYRKSGAGGSSDFYFGYTGSINNGVVETNLVVCNSMFSSSVSGMLMRGNTFAGSVANLSPSSYPDNTYTSTRPTTGSTVVLRPNLYDATRAHLAIYNWSQQSSVVVSVAGFLNNGDNYELRSAINYFGDVLTGTCSGTTITVPMTGHTASMPSGLSAPVTAFPAFGAFVLTRVGASTGNTAPTVSPVGNQSINANTSAGPLAVTVGDAETAAGNLTLTASSSNVSLVPNANIVLAGSGSSRTITVTPAAGQSGSATINLTVSDGSLTASTSFKLTVTAANTAPTISSVANQAVNANTSTGPLAVTIGDAETSAGSLSLTASSSNTTLIPNANIVLAGSGANRTVTVTPAVNQSGTTTITLTVSDGSLTANTTFAVTVSPANTAPTISGIANQTINANTAAGPIAFNIGDAQTSADSLILTAGSSYMSLVPASSITLSGSGSSRTITITPAPNQSGTTIITLTVSDGALAANTSFSITVNPITPVNTAPNISTVANQAISANTSAGPLSVIVGDAETAAGSLTLTANSSNPSLIPNSAIALGGSGSSRTVAITPAVNQSGSAIITLTVSDGALTANTSFTVTVAPANTAPTISSVANQTINANGSAGPLAVTVGDAETPAGNLTLTANSSNQSLVPNSAIVLAGSGNSHTITVTPTANQSGTAIITLTVSDGSLSMNTSFNVSVIPVTPGNTSPAISTVPNQVIYANSSTGPLAVSVADAETAAGSLTLVADSSNTSLVPNSAIILGGSNGSRTATITPVAGLSGTTIITLTVSDGALSSITSFILTVKPVVPVNTPPTITSVADQSIYANTTLGPLSFIIGDNDTPVSSLILLKSSSNPSVVPAANITLGGSGANRTVTITPAADQTGQSQINLTVSDGTNTAQASFTVTVNPSPAGNTPPTISSIANQTINANTTAGPLTFSIGDAETLAGNLTILVSSSNPTLVPTGGIGLGRINDSTRLITVTPTAHQTGTATITLTVSDGVLSSSTSFILTVNASAANDSPPVISSISSQTVGTNTVAGPLPFTVDDASMSPDNVMVTASSSNLGLVPSSAIILGGSGRYRTVTIAPTKARTGSAMITVRASAGTLSSSTSFGLNVLAVSTNSPPTISAIGDQLIPMNRSGRLRFSVSDDQKRTKLILAHMSSNPSLIPETNIKISGGKNNRTVKFTPVKGQTGTATITLSVGDGQFTTFTSFNVTVAPQVPKADAVAKRTGASSLPVLAEIPDQVLEANTASAPLPLTVIGTTVPASSLRFTATSSNSKLIPSAGVTFDNSRTGPAMTITPATDHSGIAAITVTVSDGTEEASTSFAVAVNPLVSTNQMVYVPAASSAGHATFDVDIPATGNYVVWCHVLANGATSGALQVAVDNGSPDNTSAAPYIPSSSWQWTAVAVGSQTFTPHPIALTSGLHTLSFQTPDPNVSIDRVIVTNDRQILFAELAP